MLQVMPVMSPQPKVSVSWVQSYYHGPKVRVSWFQSYYHAKKLGMKMIRHICRVFCNHIWLSESGISKRLIMDSSVKTTRRKLKHKHHFWRGHINSFHCHLFPLTYLLNFLGLYATDNNSNLPDSNHRKYWYFIMTHGKCYRKKIVIELPYSFTKEKVLTICYF